MCVCVFLMYKILQYFCLKFNPFWKMAKNNKIWETLSTVKDFPDAPYLSSRVHELIYRKGEKNLSIINNPLDIFIFFLKKGKPFNVCHLV